jgi:hypothetical protein
MSPSTHIVAVVAIVVGVREAARRPHAQAA